MSTLKEITESKVTVFIREKEGVLASLLKDSITFSFLALCIYISSGSNWWTFFTGTLFLFLLWSKTCSLIGKNANTFTDCKSAIEYLEKFDREAS